MSNIKDNPENVTLDQVLRAQFGTDLTVTELEVLTNGSNADSLHMHETLRSSATTVTATSHTAADDPVILVDDDTAGSAVTVTLPAAADSDGLIYHVKKLGTTANVVIDGDGSETIDESTTFTITVQYDTISVFCDGTEWWII